MNIFNKYILLILLFTSFLSNAASKQEQIEIIHPKFSEPLVFNVTLPSGYAKNTSKSYVMMFDFHPNSDAYLRGMHDWMSHNGEWPWLQTIIVTPAAGNRVGMLFDATGKTTPLLNFFDEQLFSLVDKKYRTAYSGDGEHRFRFYREHLNSTHWVHDIFNLSVHDGQF